MFSIVFFVQFEIFLVLDIMSNLLLQPGTLWYYIVRLWHLFKFSVLAGFISHHPRSGRGGASSLPQMDPRVIDPSESAPRRATCLVLSQQNETELDSEAKESFIPWSENRKVCAPGPGRRLSCRLWAGLPPRVSVSREQWGSLHTALSPVWAHTALSPRPWAPCGRTRPWAPCGCNHYPSGTLVWSAGFNVSVHGCLWASDTTLST